MSLKQLAIGFALAMVVAVVTCYLILLGLGWLYHEGDPLIRGWFE